LTWKWAQELPLETWSTEKSSTNILAQRRSNKQQAKIHQLASAYPVGSTESTTRINSLEWLPEMKILASLW
jgi:hypothetical protein